jgi:hypothetical protein
MSISLSRVSGTAAFLVILLATSLASRPQSLPATPHTPDLLGIYPGMPMNAARAMLQKHSSKYSVQSNAQPESGFSLQALDIRDSVSVDLTRAPNEPMVWRISRGQNIWTNNPMSPSALIAALREKYGKETMSQDRGGGGQYFFWIFDPNGRLLASADPALMNCTTGGFTLHMATGPPPSATEIEKKCYRSFFAVTAFLNRAATPDLLQSYNVELANLPYAYSAAMNALHARDAEAEKARVEQQKKADKNKPSF